MPKLPDITDLMREQALSAPLAGGVEPVENDSKKRKQVDDPDTGKALPKLDDLPIPDSVRLHPQLPPVKEGK